MSAQPARIAAIVLGVVALVTGGVWIGQGLNLIPGSFMTGNRMWFYIGVVLGVVGIVLLVVGFTRRRPARG